MSGLQLQPLLPRAAWLSAAALALLGTLVFLFLKTESSSYKDQAQALSLLRELKDLDSRWDSDALRHANALSSAAPAVHDRGPVLARILHELSQDAVRVAIGPPLDGIRAGFANKQELFAALVGAHMQALAAQRTASEALAAVISEAPAAKAREGRSVEATNSLTLQADRILAAMRTADIESAAELEGAVESHLAILGAAAEGAEPRLAAAASRAEAATREFLRARGAEADAWNKFAFLTVGARVELAARELGTRIEGARAEKDRWRAYLVAYAAALLIGLGYLASRLLAAGAAHRAANVDLKERVGDRTTDLPRTIAQLQRSVERTASLMATLQSHSADPEALRAAFADPFADLERLREHQVMRDLDTLAKDGLHGIEQISELVANLRNFSRLDRSRIASFNVNESVNGAFLTSRTLQRKIEVEKTLGEIPSITCSPSQVNQVVLNLVTNAVEAMDKPVGRIIATTRAEGDGAVAIEITDNGRGIAPEHLGRIFDPVFTTKAVGSGTGLGLSIAYKIVSQHGGRIDVRSQVGVGSTFTVILPIEPPEAPAGGPPASHAAAA